MPVTTASTYESLKEAIRLCDRGSWRRGLELLAEVERNNKDKGSLPGLFYSYLGQAIARCEGRKREGLALCRFAVKEQPMQPENYLNLAYCYLMLGQRKRSYQAMLKGIQLDSRHPGLVELAKRLGIRRRPPIPFLSRESLLNRLIGQLTYRLRQGLSGAGRRARAL